MPLFCLYLILFIYFFRKFIVTTRCGQYKKKIQDIAKKSENMLQHTIQLIRIFQEKAVKSKDLTHESFFGTKLIYSRLKHIVQSLKINCTVKLQKFKSKCSTAITHNRHTQYIYKTCTMKKVHTRFRQRSKL